MGLRIIVMGAPGAGKGTQAKRIAKSRGVPHVSTGDIFRKHIKEKTPLGLEVRKFIDKGKLAPDHLACELISYRLQQDDCKDGYILDGFPRSRPQAECFDDLLKGRGESLDLVINIEVSDDEIVARLSSRRMCPKCGAIYNLRSNPPRHAGLCDGATCNNVELIQRKDDREETIRRRLGVYHGVSEPIKEFYEKQGRLASVVGRGLSPDAVFAQIEALIDSNDLVCLT